VLVEGPVAGRPGLVRGSSCRAVPVALPGRLEVLLRRRVPVRAVGLIDGMLLGEPEPEAESAEGTVAGGRIPLVLW